MKKLIVVHMLILTLFYSCSKDMNMDDYNSNRLQQTISRISSVSGTYSGNIISKLDGSSLGTLILTFQAKTDVQTNSQQQAVVSGTLQYKSLTNADIVFDKGSYNEETGGFQIIIPVDTTQSLSLDGVINGGKFYGSIEIQGRSDYGASLELVKNAPVPNVSTIEVGGTRMQQIQKLNYKYIGSYNYGQEVSPMKLTFRDPDTANNIKKFSNILSPTRTVNAAVDMGGFSLSFNDSIIDDKNGTLSGKAIFNDQKDPQTIYLSCLKFEESADNFGYDCEVQTRTTTIPAHLKATR
jgi:hypothetical protein